MSGLGSESMKKPLRERSSLVYVLVALIPYSKPNLLLSYKPGLFFRELEKVSHYKRSTLQKAYYRGINSGLISNQDNGPRLTALGKRKVAPFVASKLGSNASLMVIFDIPEKRAADRRILRALLRQWNFKQVQKSVWVSGYDFREPLIEAITQLKLAEHVQIHENALLFPKNL